jgi:hypothetical protein
MDWTDLVKMTVEANVRALAAKGDKAWTEDGNKRLMVRSIFQNNLLLNCS